MVLSRTRQPPDHDDRPKSGDQIYPGSSRAGGGGLLPNGGLPAITAPPPVDHPHGGGGAYDDDDDDDDDVDNVSDGESENYYNIIAHYLAVTYLVFPNCSPIYKPPEVNFTVDS